VNPELNERIRRALKLPTVRFPLGPGRAGKLWINAFGATHNPLTPDFARFLFIAEISEQLMFSAIAAPE
jgi:hypothetical protein